jgi:hypothetical protein
MGTKDSDIRFDRVAASDISPERMSKATKSEHIPI